MKQGNRKRIYRTFRYVGITVATLIICVAAVWLLAPYFVDDPLPKVYKRTPVRIWCDRNGIPLYYERTWNYEWRFDVSLDDIPDDVVSFMINTEDERFFHHHGVDYIAIARAFTQNLIAGRVLSGASTISMQVAAMDYLGRRRKLGEKFLQAAKARKMERLHSKREILEAYFNNVPYGGSIYGLGAASRYYFGKTPGDLTIVEASVLCGIPQLPNRFRPDRHPDLAKVRQSRVLDSQVREGYMTREEADRIFYHERLPYRNFDEPADFEKASEARELGFIIDTDKPFVHGDPQTQILTIDSRITDRIRNILSKKVNTLPDVRDAAAFLIDAKSGDTIAYVGTLDFKSPDGGQVDVIKSIRSAGSLIKPFIYYEALCAGYIVSDTTLLDAPVRYAGYKPKNFDGKYRGRVPVFEALSNSYNTPVIRLLSHLGEARINRTLSSLGLATDDQVKTNGLSLALGTAGYRLYDIVKAYQRIIPEINGPINDSARAMLAEILRSNPLPGTSHSIAWKTGTSNNNCDAWCVGYTTDYVLGVWFGNKNGERSSSLIGAKVAAPVVGEIFQMLYDKEKPPFWLERNDYSERVELCKESGLLATSGCREKSIGRALKNIPLNPCVPCNTTVGKAVILSPAPKVYHRNGEETSVTLLLRSSHNDVVWFIDGNPLEQNTKSYNFPVGKHTITAVPLDPQKTPAEVTIVVM